MSDPFQDVDSAGIEFAEITAKTMEIRQSEPVMEKIVKDYLGELEFTHRKLTIEVGCGPGAISRRISEYASGSKVIGFDPAKNYIDIARNQSEHLTNLSFEAFDGQRIPLDDGTVDNVIMHTVLSHVIDPSHLIGEAYRLLVKGGKLVICDADFSKATLASSQDDPLSLASSYFVRSHVTDPHLLRKIEPLCAGAGLVSEKFDMASRVVTGNGMRMWVEVAAKAMVESNDISPALGEALVAEYDHRVKEQKLYGFLPFFTFISKKT